MRRANLRQRYAYYVEVTCYYSTIIFPMKFIDRIDLLHTAITTMVAYEPLCMRHLIIEYTAYAAHVIESVQLFLLTRLVNCQLCQESMYYVN